MTLPNKLSLFRIVLVPVLVIVYLLPIAGGIHVCETTIPYKDIISLIIFCVASITDMLDGKIARKYNLITSFGKFIDPIADKLLVNTSFILLAYTGRVSIIAVIIMIARDTIVDAIRMMASQKGRVMAAGMPGKVKTVLQMFAIIIVFLNDVPFTLISLPMGTILVWLATIVSVYSGYVYFKQAKDIILESM